MLFLLSGVNHLVVILPHGSGLLLVKRLRLREYLLWNKALHEDFLRHGYGDVELPYALIRGYPNAGQEWAWQYVPEVDLRNPLNT